MVRGRRLVRSSSCAGGEVCSMGRVVLSVVVVVVVVVVKETEPPPLTKNDICLLEETNPHEDFGIWEIRNMAANRRFIMMIGMKGKVEQTDEEVSLLSISR